MWLTSHRIWIAGRRWQSAMLDLVAHRHGVTGSPWTRYLDERPRSDMNRTAGEIGIPGREI